VIISRYVSQRHLVTGYSIQYFFGVFFPINFRISSSLATPHRW
ncbi:unnamed protein product, partial [Tenebrio molitor]